MGLASRHLWIFFEDRKASAAAASILGFKPKNGS